MDNIIDYVEHSVTFIVLIITGAGLVWRLVIRPVAKILQTVITLLDELRPNDGKSFADRTAAQFEQIFTRLDVIEQRIDHLGEKIL